MNSKKNRIRNKLKNRIYQDILTNYGDNVLISSIYKNGQWEKYSELNLEDLAQNKVYTPLKIEVQIEVDLGRDQYQFDVIQKYYIL